MAIFGNILLLYSEELAICLLNGDFQLAAYWQSVTSSTVGPMGKASGSGPLMATLPMEVLIVSTYVMPVISSFTMQLELTLEMPGVTTSWMGMVPTGNSRSTSMNSGVCKQAVTLEKPHTGVCSHMSANACVGREG